MISVFSLLVSSDDNNISTGDFTVYYSKIVVPSPSVSLIESRQLMLSRFTTIADCGLACIDTIECQTAVYNQLGQICLMYRGVGEFPGDLISGTSQDITIVLNDRSAGQSVITVSEVTLSIPYFYRCTYNKIFEYQFYWNLEYIHWR